MKNTMKFIFAALLTLSSAAYAANTACDHLVAYGYPTVNLTNTTDLCRLAYFVKHNNDKKVPAYSAEYLTIEAVNNKGVERLNLFKADPDLPVGSKAELSDYNKDYDRGHMTPFEDADANTASAMQSFYLSNMVPQDLHLNRGLWKALENRTREYAKNSKNGIYVITGPVFIGTIKTIGTNKVNVPTKVFKIIIDKETNQGIGFLVPNESPAKGVKFTAFAVPISTIEKLVNFNFTPSLPQNKQLWKNTIGTQFK